MKIQKSFFYFLLISLSYSCKDDQIIDYTGLSEPKHYSNYLTSVVNFIERGDSLNELNKHITFQDKIEYMFIFEPDIFSIRNIFHVYFKYIAEILNNQVKFELCNIKAKETNIKAQSRGIENWLCIAKNKEFYILSAMNKDGSWFLNLTEIGGSIKQYILCRDTLKYIFKSTFESGLLNAELGNENIDIRAGGNLKVVVNPNPDGVNSSKFCLKSVIPSYRPELGLPRAEYETQRVITAEKTYIYRWQLFLNQNHFEDISFTYKDGVVISQFKTYPCSRYGGFEKEISGEGGIYNEIRSISEGFYYRLRANPDYYEFKWNFIEGKWNDYILKIYYTKSSKGYAELYRNGLLIDKVRGIKTLFDSFPSKNSTCDMYWSLGQYSGWTSNYKDSLTVYIDNINLFDCSDGINLKDIAPEYSFTDSCRNLRISSSIVIDEDQNQSNGAIEIEVSGGTEPYTFLWNDNQKMQNRKGVGAEKFTIKVTDNVGCNVCKEFNVKKK
jgi:hypothetical protein